MKKEVKMYILAFIIVITVLFAIDYIETTNLQQEVVAYAEAAY